ncbi:MAG TPA: tetratricopeptide repeat protein [Herpetosiphonaceae bacterium]
MTGSDVRACPNCQYELRTSSLFCPACGEAVLPAVENGLQVVLQQILGSVPPGKAEVLRRCAIPRWIDAPIMGVIRDREDGNNETILEQLSEYSFVRSVGDGRYTYSEDVRTLLLSEWRQRPDELREVQKRLYRYFERKMGGSDEASRAMWVREVAIYDLLLASSTLASETAPPEISVGPRLLLASTLEARIERSLLRYRELIEKAERSFRLADAEALLVAAEEQADLLAPQIRDWLLYYRAEVDHMAVKLQSSIEGYRRLLKRPNLEPELQAKAAISLGDVLVETGAMSTAIHAYHDALEMPKLDADLKAAAHIGLADAYNEIAVSAGGWYILPPTPHPLLRLLRRIGESVALIPMMILVTLLRRLGAAVPTPQILMRYRNWLLARIFRASREQVEAAYEIFKTQKDDYNIARCEMRLIEIDVLFGQIKPSVARAWSLFERPFAQNIYRKARAQLTMARALLADGQPEAARTEAERALAVFRSLDDGRWETRALNILGRVQLETGQPEASLATFTEALERSRQIGSMLSRERTLYELRLWRRQAAQHHAAVDALLSNEPVQRFVGRMPRFLLPILQVIQATVLPLLLLLASAITPLTKPPASVTVDAGNLMLLPSATDYVFPVGRLLITPLIILVLVGIAYSLTGLLVLWRMPLRQLEENQPDVIVVEPDHIVQFDSKGEECGRVAFAEVKEYVTADRMIWRRPLSVFSRTFLDAGEPPIIRMDGVLSWYNGLCLLVRERIAAAGAQARMVDQSLSLLRSVSGFVLGAGLLLLFFMILVANGLFESVVTAMPANLFALLQQVAYSGILVIIPMVFWGVISPLRLRRDFILNDRLPWVIGIGGLLLTTLTLATGGKIVRIPTLSVTLVLTGLVLVTEAAFTLISKQTNLRRFIPLRAVAHLAVLSFGVWLVLTPLLQSFYKSRAYAHWKQGDFAAELADQVAVAKLADDSWINQSSALELGIVAAQEHNWGEANSAFDEAVAEAGSPAEQAAALHDRARTQVLQANPEAPDTQALKLGLADVEQAIAISLNQSPEPHSVALETKGDIYMLLREPGDARAAFQQAQALTGNAQRDSVLEQKLARIP